MANDKIIKDVATNLQLYFQLGCIKRFKQFNKLLNEHFVEKETLPKKILDEIKSMEEEKVRVDFVHIAHRIYKRGQPPKDVISGIERCERLILDVFNFKVEDGSVKIEFQGFKSHSAQQFYQNNRSIHIDNHAEIFAFAEAYANDLLIKKSERINQYISNIPTHDFTKFHVKKEIEKILIPKK